MTSAGAMLPVTPAWSRCEHLQAAGACLPANCLRLLLGRPTGMDTNGVQQIFNLIQALQTAGRTSLAGAPQHEDRLEASESATKVRRRAQYILVHAK